MILNEPCNGSRRRRRDTRLRARPRADRQECNDAMLSQSRAEHEPSSGRRRQHCSAIRHGAREGALSRRCSTPAPQHQDPTNRNSTARRSGSRATTSACTTAQAEILGHFGSGAMARAASEDKVRQGASRSSPLQGERRPRSPRAVSSRSTTPSSATTAFPRRCDRADIHGSWGCGADPTQRRARPGVKREGMVRDYSSQAGLREGRSRTASAEAIDGGEKRACSRWPPTSRSERGGREAAALPRGAARALLLTIHDELGQALTGLKLDLARLRRAWTTSPESRTGCSRSWSASTGPSTACAGSPPSSGQHSRPPGLVAAIEWLRRT